MASMKKTVSVVVIGIVILNALFLAWSAISTMIFWTVVAGAAVVAYFVVPKLKNS